MRPHPPIWRSFLPSVTSRFDAGVGPPLAIGWPRSPFVSAACSASMRWLKLRKPRPIGVCSRLARHGGAVACRHRCAVDGGDFLFTVPSPDFGRPIFGPLALWAVVLLHFTGKRFAKGASAPGMDSALRAALIFLTSDAALILLGTLASSLRSLRADAPRSKRWSRGSSQSVSPYFCSSSALGRSLGRSLMPTLGRLRGAQAADANTSISGWRLSDRASARPCRAGHLAWCWRPAGRACVRTGAAVVAFAGRTVCGIVR